MADQALALSPSHPSSEPRAKQEGSSPKERKRKDQSELDNTWSTQDMELISNTSAGECPSELTFRYVWHNALFAMTVVCMCVDPLPNVVCVTGMCDDPLPNQVSVICICDEPYLIRLFFAIQ